MTLTQILQKLKSVFYTKSESDALLLGKSNTTHNHDSVYLGINAKASSASSADSVTWGGVSGKPSTFTPSSHTHDDRYYTESEVNTKLNGKSNTDHNHNSVYLGINAKATSATTADNGVDSYGNGWIRFKCGLQICFGIAFAGQNNSFPNPFKSGVSPEINLTPRTSHDYPYSATVLHGTDAPTTNSSFNFLLWADAIDQFVNYDCHYIAIGRWK